LAGTSRLLSHRLLLHVMINAYWEALEFEIPSPGDPHEHWRRVIDTFLDSPDDICGWAKAPQVPTPAYRVQPRSVVLLIARAAGDDGKARAP